jgi:protein-disulfide isomerase
MRRRLLQFTAVLLLSVTVPAQQKVDPALPSEDTVNAFLRQSFGYDPSVTWRIASIRPSQAQGLAEVVVVLGNAQGQQVTTFYVTPDGKHALVGDMIPFGATPYAEARQALEKGMNGVAKGPADAKVTIVEFSDLQCPHCKEAQPIVDKLLGDEPNAKYVMQQYPLPMHNWAAKAADYSDCLGRMNKDAYWKFVHEVFDQQSNVTESTADEKLTALADQAGVKGSEVAACAAKPETKARVDASIALGTSVGVNSTPTLYVNGRRISNVVGLPYEVLKELVEYAAKQP